MSDPSRPPLRGPTVALLRALLPYAERDEVLADLADELTDRRRRHGRVRAQVWLWRQTLGSAPALLRRSWWRGATGFEPHASALRPGGPVFERWIVDLRYSARRLAHRRGYAALAILTLALGAGGSAAIFSITRTLLLDPLPIAREADVGVFWFNGSWTEEEFLQLRPTFPGFQRVAAYRPNDATLEIPGDPMRLVTGISCSAELFDVLGARPHLGRTFNPGDDRPGSEIVAVISHGLWQELGGSESIVGRRLRLGGVNRTIVGVMPQGFWFPTPTTRVWLARQFSPQVRAGQYTLIGRVADGGSIGNLQQPLATLTAALGARFKYPQQQWDKTRSPSVTPLREFLVGDVRAPVVATTIAMVVILLIACVNVAALMLGQVSGRASELAIRASLGAERGRLVQQLAIESLLVGVLAGGLGSLLAVGGFGVLVHALPLGALADSARVDWTLFWASTLVAIAGAALIALVPALAFWRWNLNGMMATTRTVGVSARGGRLEGAFVVGQIALAVVLAVGAALLLRSVANLRRIDPGLHTSGVVLVDATMPSQLDVAARQRAVLEAIPLLQALPGVRSAAAVQRLPLRGSGDNWGITVEGRPDLPPTTTAFRMVSRDYFTTVGVPITRGRGFDATDHTGSERVVVINEALAAKYFAGEDPIGHRLNSGFDDQLVRIIGVVGNMAEATLTEASMPARYLLYDQNPIVWQQVTLAVRAADPSKLNAVLEQSRAALRRSAPQLAIREITTLDAVVDEAVGPAGQLATLLSLLAALALVLDAVGVYGMISHYVGRRTREYGIRIALGLAPQRVLWQVVGRGTALVAVGSAIGLAGALAMTGVLSSLLYGIDRADPWALAGGVGTLLIVGALAAFVPAWGASRTDPVIVLRQQ